MFDYFCIFQSQIFERCSSTEHRAHARSINEHLSAFQWSFVIYSYHTVVLLLTENLCRCIIQLLVQRIFTQLETKFKMNQGLYEKKMSLKTPFAYFKPTMKLRFPPKKLSGKNGMDYFKVVYIIIFWYTIPPNEATTSQFYSSQGFILKKSNC